MITTVELQATNEALQGSNTSTTLSGSLAAHIGEEGRTSHVIRPESTRTKTNPSKLATAYYLDLFTMPQPSFRLNKA